jgi:hypothetical protein
MQRLILVLGTWLLPLFVLADLAPTIALRLIEGDYLPGDVLELEAKMRGPEYAEFELHVPANPQCHFVAQTREPVHYVGGEYMQSVRLLLQPMSAGDFELAGITATIAQGGVARDVALPSVLFSVASYAAEDMSKSAAELGASAFLLTQASNHLRIIIAVLFVVLMLVWLLLRKINVKPLQADQAEVGLDDLIAILEDSPGLAPGNIAEQILKRTNQVLSPNLREHLEAAVYGKQMDAETLLRLLREERAR